jgi:hypothetical protein
MSQNLRKLNSQKSIWKNPLVIVCLAAVAYWLFTYHSQHLLGWLPYLIILLCPLMHIFMHGGHSHGGHGGHNDLDTQNQANHQHHHSNEEGR